MNRRTVLIGTTAAMLGAIIPSIAIASPKFEKPFCNFVGDLKEDIPQIMESYSVELNNEITRNKISVDIENYMNYYYSQAKYAVVCNENNNNSSVIDNNGLVVDIYYRPSENDNFLALNFRMISTGISFEIVKETV